MNYMKKFADIFSFARTKCSRQECKCLINDRLPIIHIHVEQIKIFIFTAGHLML